MAVGVDKPRSHRHPPGVQDLCIQLPKGNGRYLRKLFPIDQQLPGKRLFPCAVADDGIFHLYHTSIPLASTGILRSTPSSKTNTLFCMLTAVQT